MNANKYQKLAMRTNDGKASDRLIGKMQEYDMKFANDHSDNDCVDIGGIFNACLGLSGEVGEFNDMIKKWVFHEKELDMEHAKKEAGDILWLEYGRDHADECRQAESKISRWIRRGKSQS